MEDIYADLEEDKYYIYITTILSLCYKKLNIVVFSYIMFYNDISNNILSIYKEE